ncbi:MAG: hypothetical protein B7Z66_04535 [Chromatiales bacterium 21-64-14]|nr:MAG: hypothetical protein B7Z66_04535 [Chromatiales bacterium 21-64-14]HQU14596.1 Slp family lipoprotein [Gammaproteobacteria bacterium]
MNRLYWCWTAALLLAGCASPVPPPIGSPPPGSSPTVAQVRADPNGFSGAQVRWGGTIAAVENGTAQTWIQVVARPLARDGRPSEEGDASAGRFLAEVSGFLDPEIYAKGRLITVAGRLDHEVTRPIGRFEYHFPVVTVEAYYLWPPLPKRERYGYPRYYYDPWWSPWYPWGPPYWGN